MGKRVAIVQSCYIPWKGYFDLINKVDEFILLDDVQYTRADWRNRNRIKTANGTAWLTIPVKVKGRYRQDRRAGVHALRGDDPVHPLRRAPRLPADRVGRGGGEDADVPHLV